MHSASPVCILVRWWCLCMALLWSSVLSMAGMVIIGWLQTVIGDYFRFSTGICCCFVTVSIWPLFLTIFYCYFCYNRDQAVILVDNVLMPLRLADTRSSKRSELETLPRSNWPSISQLTKRHFKLEIWSQLVNVVWFDVLLVNTKYIGILCLWISIDSWIKSVPIVTLSIYCLSFGILGRQITINYLN